jgi:hypothetical protein
VPIPRPGEVAALDNLGAHKVKAVRAVIEAGRAGLSFLPPWSPDLAPGSQHHHRGQCRAARRSSRPSPSSRRCSAPLSAAPSTPSGRRSAMPSTPSPPPNAPILPRAPAMFHLTGTGANRGHAITMGPISIVKSVLWPTKWCRARAVRGCLLFHLHSQDRRAERCGSPCGDRRLAGFSRRRSASWARARAAGARRSAPGGAARCPRPLERLIAADGPTSDPRAISRIESPRSTAPYDAHGGLRKHGGFIPGIRHGDRVPV